MGIGDLFQVISISADVDILDDLVGGGGVEVDGLASLRSVGIFAHRRRVVGGIPEIMDAPAGSIRLAGKRVTA